MFIIEINILSEIQPQYGLKKFYRFWLQTAVPKTKIPEKIEDSSVFNTKRKMKRFITFWKEIQLCIESGEYPRVQYKYEM